MFTQKIIDEISEYASLLTPPSDIAVLLDIDEDVLLAELSIPSSPVRKAYRKAKAITALAMRRQELELAKVGSPLAVQMASLYIRNMDLNEDL